MEKHSSVEIAGVQSTLENAPEPTNIIWENLGFDVKKRFFKIVLMIFIAFLIVSLSFTFMKTASNRISNILDKYDNSVPCEDLFNFYGRERAE